MIALIKKGRIDKTIKVFENWYDGGKWCDENIKQDFDKYYFQKIGKIRTFWLKIFGITV